MTKKVNQSPTKKEDELTWSHLESPPPRTSFSLSSGRRARWLIWQWGRQGIFPRLHLPPYLHPSHLWREKRRWWVMRDSLSHMSHIVVILTLKFTNTYGLRSFTGNTHYICATLPKFSLTAGPSNCFCWATRCVIFSTHDSNRPGTLRKSISVTVKHNCWSTGGDQ